MAQEHSLLVEYYHYSLHWVFGALSGSSLVVVSGGCSLFVVHGFIAVVPLVVEHGLQGMQAPVAVECRLSSCGTWA